MNREFVTQRDVHGSTGVMMRIAGFFSELSLAVVGCGLALTVFAETPNAEQSGMAGSPSQEHARANDTASPDPVAGLARWAAPAVVVREIIGPDAARPSAISAYEASDGATTAVGSGPVSANTVTPTRGVQLEQQVAPPTSVIAARSSEDLTAASADSPMIPAAALPVPTVTVDPAELNGGTPGLRPAKVLFGAVRSPAPTLAARAIGSYSKGCLSGGQALPVDGPAWQAMRLSRNRNWGHPKLIGLIERLALDGKTKDNWPGLLVGDMAQPRGGPMLTGHASHQIGLDADIWLTPMPDRRLTNQERETIEATSMLGDDGVTVNRDVWTDQHLKIIKRAASYSEVERIFVHPAIKQVLCYAARDDRAWLSKVRPYWGHYYHFHVRMTCPPGSENCTPQKGVPGDDGCGKELDDWLKLIANDKAEPAPLPLPTPQPPVVTAKAKEKRPMTLDQLPSQCSVVLANGNPQLLRDITAAKAAHKAAEVATAAAMAAKSALAHPAKVAGSASTSAMLAAAGTALSPATKSNAAPASPASGKPASIAKGSPKEKKTDTQ